MNPNVPDVVVTPGALKALSHHLRLDDSSGAVCLYEHVCVVCVHRPHDRGTN